MDTEKWGALLCAVETGSLTGAAERLGYTPSGVSRIVAALEAEAGFPLLARSRGGVRPTPACETLLPALRELVRCGEHCRQLAAQVRGLETGAVTVGTSYSLYYRWLSRLVAAFTARHPGIRVDIVEGVSSELSGALAEGRVDLCVISRREGPFRWLSLREDPLVAWVPADHPAAAAGVFPLAAFQTEPFIEIFPGRETDNSRFFARQGIRPNTRYTTCDVWAAWSMVEAGLGVTLTNALYDLPGGVAAVPLDPPQTVSIGIALPPEDVLSPAARRFAAFASSFPQPR